MGMRTATKRRNAADRLAEGPAMRALASPVRVPPPPRLPSLHEPVSRVRARDTQSEIELVLGGLKSVPPQPGDGPARDAPDAAHVRASSAPSAKPSADHASFDNPRFETPPPPADTTEGMADRAESARRRRQRVVLAAVCSFGAVVFALAALRGSHGRAASSSEAHRPAQIAPMPPPPTSPLATAAAQTALDSPSFATSTAVTGRAPPGPKASPAKPGSRPPRSRRTYDPNSI